MVPARLLLILAMLLTSGAAHAQELLFLGGNSKERSLSETTYAWAIEYAHGLSNNTFVTFAWHNEGHLEDHHRDGPAVQFWGHIDLLDQHLSLVLGAGPYSYFDTAQAAQGASYNNDHGLGMIYSAGLNWYTRSRWFLQLRANHIETDSDVDTSALLLGVGYQLTTPSGVGPRTIAPPFKKKTTNNEITFFVGRTILNSFSSESSTASAIEYRRGLNDYLDWTVAWLHEGAHHIIRRNGVTSQLWLVRAFVNDRLMLGIGAGGYFVVNKEQHASNSEGNDERLSGILTTTASYRFNPQWFARLSWNRIMTGYDRDTDVILTGIGYRF
jgi:hypothetical protein